ncbi:MAG: ATP-binding protein [Alphaproteobacteria bacterium]|nr:ATP-binding protein [Alphaproteobacteria bacterium]MCL2505026.1 ATP-binding protein [Alphaproteobacteria bacterium]
MLKKLNIGQHTLLLTRISIVLTGVVILVLCILYPFIFFPVLTVFFGGMCIKQFFSLKSLKHDMARQATHVLHIKHIAQRMQAMLASAPFGYCVFTTQGVLKETANAAGMLGCEKISQLQDVLDVIDEAEELSKLFQELQSAGNSFTCTVSLKNSNEIVKITGQRMHIGKGAPFLLDTLWFSPHFEKPVPQTDSQKSNRKQLTAIAEQAQAVYDKIKIPMWFRNKKLDIVLCNDAYASAMDSTKEEIYQKQLELHPSSAVAENSKTLANKVLAECSTMSERRHVIVNGNRRLLEITEMPYETKYEKGLFGFAIDVTAEEESREAIKSYTSSYKEVLENLGSAIAVYGADTKLEFYNSAYRKLWKAEEAFLDSRPLFSEVLEDHRARQVYPEHTDFRKYKKDRLALFTSIIEPQEELLCLGDGTTLRVVIAPNPMGGLMFVHEDVTARLELESSYNTLVDVQKETIDNLAEGIVVFGLDGKVSIYNPSVEKIWNLPKGFMDTKPHVSEVLEKTKNLHSYSGEWEDYKKTAISHMFGRNLRTGRMKLSNNTVLDFVSIPLPDGAMLNSYLDVTNSIKAERALKAKNLALREADRMKSEFVASVSYQLRTPLNTIMGFSEILSNQSFGTLNDKQKEYTDIIMDSSKKLLLLINDVLDLATIEAGKMTLETETISVAEVINSAKEMVSDWAKQHSLDIAVTCPKDVGSFEVDVNRIRQVLFNLISNAIQYTPVGGKIAIEAKKHDDKDIIISVTDTGVGIAEEDLNKIFGKFETSRKTAKQSGVGLGLSLVKSFVELHGGSIHISSIPHQGTRVSCVIPIKAVTRDSDEGDDEYEILEEIA